MAKRSSRQEEARDRFSYGRNYKLERFKEVAEEMGYPVDYEDPNAYWPGRYERDLMRHLDLVEIIEEAPCHAMSTTLHHDSYFDHNYNAPLPGQLLKYYLRRMYQSTVFFVNGALNEEMG